jgi:hypothetical protein
MTSILVDFIQSGITNLAEFSTASEVIKPYLSSVVATIGVDILEAGVSGVACETVTMIGGTALSTQLDMRGDNATGPFKTFLGLTSGAALTAIGAKVMAEGNYVEGITECAFGLRTLALSAKRIYQLIS